MFSPRMISASLSAALLTIGLVACAPTSPGDVFTDKGDVEVVPAEEPAVDLPQPDCRDTILHGGYIGDDGDDEVEGFLFPEFLPDGALDHAGCLMTSKPAGFGYTHQVLWFFNADLDLYDELRSHAAEQGLDPISFQDTDRSGYTWSAAEIWEKPSDPAKWSDYRYDFLESNRDVDDATIREYVWEGSFLAYVSESHPVIDEYGYVSDYGPVIFLGWTSKNAS